MKNSFKYLKLWQKKRSEMPLDADPQADWMQMASMLDQHLPLSDIPENNKPTPSKGFKLLSMMLIGLSAAAMTYVFSYVTDVHHKRAKEVFHGNSLSVSRSMRADSVTGKADASGILTTSIKHDSIVVSRSDGDNANSSSENSKTSVVGSKALPVASISVTKAADVKNGSSIKSAASNNSAPLAGSVAGKNANASGKLNGSTVNKGVVSGTSITTGSRNGTAVNGSKPIRNNAAIVSNRTRGGSSPPGAPTPLSNKTGKNELNTARNYNASLHSIALNNRSRSHNIRTNTNGATGLSTVSNEKRAGHHLGVQDANMHKYFEALQATTPNPVFKLGAKNPLTIASLRAVSKSQSSILNQIKDNKKDKKAKDAKPSAPSTPLNIDWGLLMGFNSAGSFTSKAQNSNFYGSLPVDPFFGLFVAYNLNDKWSIGAQVRALNPLKISGTYTHANGSKVDTNQLIKVSDSRKAYTVDIPLNVIYKVNDNLSFKAGPVFSIPVKVMGGSSTLQPTAVKSDTTYYRKIITQIDSIKYQPKFNYGISVGVSYQVNRFIFGVDYLKNLGGYQVNSGFGNYKSHNGTLQITIGFRLNKKK